MLRNIALFSRKRVIKLFIGTQDLYGEKILALVLENAIKIANFFTQALGIKIEMELLLKRKQITRAFSRAQRGDVIGIIIWCHTFSPSRMWVDGLKLCTKPLLCLNTQFFAKCPWLTIDMNTMNLNQSAHGDREFVAILVRLRKVFEIIVGHWQDVSVIRKIKVWVRACMVLNDGQDGEIGRVGDYMRFVGCTPVDPIALQSSFGYLLNGYSVADLMVYIKRVDPKRVSDLKTKWLDTFNIRQKMTDQWHQSVNYSALVYLGIRDFLLGNKLKGISYTFHDFGTAPGGLEDLPCIASQLLPVDGLGVGWEGHGLLAVLLRMANVLNFDTSARVGISEDYVYEDLGMPSMSNLRAHMDGVSYPLAGVDTNDIFLDVHPLGIGLSKNPARLVFACKPSDYTLHMSMVDRGGRIALIISKGKVIQVPDAPNLPVATLLYRGEPDEAESSKRWMLAGGPHHGVDVIMESAEQLEDVIESLQMLGRMADIEVVMIDGSVESETAFRQTLAWNQDHFDRRK